MSLKESKKYKNFYEKHKKNLKKLYPSVLEEMTNISPPFAFFDKDYRTHGGENKKHGKTFV